MKEPWPTRKPWRKTESSHSMKDVSAIRHYRVGGIPFRIELQSPWIPMEYTEPVKRRIENAAAKGI